MCADAQTKAVRQGREHGTRNSEAHHFSRGDAGRAGIQKQACGPHPKAVQNHIRFRRPRLRLRFTCGAVRFALVFACFFFPVTCSDCIHAYLAGSPQAFQKLRQWICSLQPGVSMTCLTLPPAKK